MRPFVGRSRRRGGSTGGGGGGGAYFSDNFDTGSFGGGTIGSEGANVFAWADTPGVVVSGVSNSGSHSMRIRYGPNAPNAEGGDQVKKYWIGKQLTEMWIEYQWLVPSNFAHRTSTGPTNNKWFAVYDEGAGAQNGGYWIGGEFVRRSANESDMRPLVTTWDKDFVDQPVSQTWHLPGVARFISSSGPVVPGVWTQIRIYIKSASSNSASDGVFNVIVNGSPFFSSTGRFWSQSTSPTDRPWARRGYLMGYSNSGFDSETDFHIDDFKLYDTNPGW